jgi:hypothetical protein
MLGRVSAEGSYQIGSLLLWKGGLPVQMEVTSAIPLQR